MTDWIDPGKPGVREKLRDLAFSDRETAPVYHELYIKWYGEEPNE